MSDEQKIVFHADEPCVKIQLSDHCGLFNNLSFVLTPGNVTEKIQAHISMPTLEYVDVLIVSGENYVSLNLKV